MRDCELYGESQSVSLARRFNATSALISIPIISSTTTGVSGVPVTEKLIVASEDVSAESFVTKVNESEPLKSTFGVYVNPDPSTETIPCDGSVTAVYVNISPGFRSYPDNVAVNESSSVIVNESDAANGGKLDPGITLSVTVPVLESQPL